MTRKARKRKSPLYQLHQLFKIILLLKLSMQVEFNPHKKFKPKLMPKKENKGI